MVRFNTRGAPFPLRIAWLPAEVAPPPLDPEFQEIGVELYHDADLEGLHTLRHQLAPLLDEELSVHDKQMKMETASIDMAMTEFDEALADNIKV
jgi:hypothetical protein